MKTLKEKYDALQLAIRIRIASKIINKGVDSTFHPDKVLAVKDDKFKFRLDGGKCLVELTANELIDEEGYQYTHSCLTIEQLCEVVDSI